MSFVVKYISRSYVLHKRSLFPLQLPVLIENMNIFNCSYCLEQIERENYLTVPFGSWNLKLNGKEKGSKPLWLRKSSWVPHVFRTTRFDGRDSAMFINFKAVYLRIVL